MTRDALDWLKRPIAHRGLHDEAKGIVENSASAVEAAIAKGYAIEVDLQCAAHGVPVVFHDRTLDRLTAETRPVADARRRRALRHSLAQQRGPHPVARRAARHRRRARAAPHRGEEHVERRPHLRAQYRRDARGLSGPMWR